MGETTVTQLRSDLDALSNYFDGLLKGIGKRGSSFTDVDSCAWRLSALSHDSDGDYFLIQEFKQATEPLSRGQGMALWALAGYPKITVWLVRVIDANVCDVMDFAPRDPNVDLPEVRLTWKDYQAHVRAWWERHEGQCVRSPQRLAWSERLLRDQTLQDFRQ